jgi:hypothetical protein
VPACSYSVGGRLWPSGAVWPQVQIGESGLPEHRAVVSKAGDGDRERLLQRGETGEGRAPVRSAQCEPGDGGVAAVPADDSPGEGVGLGRPGDSQLITGRPNYAEGVTTRACGTAPAGVGSAGMPVTAGCWLTAHAEASDASDDPSPAAACRPSCCRLDQRLWRRRFNALLESRLGSGCAAGWDLIFAGARVAGSALGSVGLGLGLVFGLVRDDRGRLPLRRPEEARAPGRCRFAVDPR